MNKRGLILLVLIVLSSIFLVYATNFNSEKLILNNDYNEKIGSTGSLVSSDNLSVGDIFYLDDGRKARVTGIEDAVDSSFDNLNFFANGILVHNKFEDFKAVLNWEPTRDVQEVLRYNREQRIAYLKEIFGEENIVGREDAIWEAHLTPILKDKLRILQRAGFNQVQRRMILRAGICGGVDIKTINPILRGVFTAPYERLPYNADIEELLLKEGLVDSIKIEYPLHKNPQYPVWMHLEGRTPHVVFRGVNPFDQSIRVRAGDGKLNYIQPGEKFHTHIVTCLPPHG